MGSAPDYPSNETAQIIAAIALAVLTAVWCLIAGYR
jgi:hypothetical protein